MSLKTAAKETRWVTLFVGSSLLAEQRFIKRKITLWCLKQSDLYILIHIELQSWNWKYYGVYHLSHVTLAQYVSSNLLLFQQHCAQPWGGSIQFFSKFFQIFVYGDVLKFGSYWPWKTVSSHLNCTTLLTLGNISYHNVTQVLTFSQSDLAFKLYHYLLASSDTFILITYPLAKNSLFTDPLFSLKSPPSALADYRKET